MVTRKLHRGERSHPEIIHRAAESLRDYTERNRVIQRLYKGEQSNPEIIQGEAESFRNYTERSGVSQRLDWWLCASSLSSFHYLGTWELLEC